MSETTAVTGKPLSHYERYVDLLANVLANGLALSTDREFLESLDRTVPLHEAVHETARESIRWRFAFNIDEIEAAGVVGQEGGAAMKLSELRVPGHQRPKVRGRRRVGSPQSSPRASGTHRGCS